MCIRDRNSILGHWKELLGSSSKKSSDRRNETATLIRSAWWHTSFSTKTEAFSKCSGTPHNRKNINSERWPTPHTHAAKGQLLRKRSERKQAIVAIDALLDEVDKAKNRLNALAAAPDAIELATANEHRAFGLGTPAYDPGRRTITFAQELHNLQRLSQRMSHSE